MPFIDTLKLEVVERLPGWYGRYFHSPSMTFAHYDFKRVSARNHNGCGAGSIISPDMGGHGGDIRQLT